MSGFPVLLIAEKFCYAHMPMNTYRNIYPEYCMANMKPNMTVMQIPPCLK